jgi:hypothetical protein
MSTCIPKYRVEEIKLKITEGKMDANEISKLLPEERAAARSILEDFVSDKLGVSVSSKEVGEIGKLAKDIDAAYKKLGVELGNPNKVQEHVDFFKAKQTMDKYLLDKHPANRLKVATGTIGRGMMLASVKSPVLNIGSNIEIGFTEALARRISSGQLRGTDSKLAVDFVKMANKIYQETGYDISRMTSLTDGGQGSLVKQEGIIHSQGPGLTRAAGRVVEDIVFKQLMGAPDVAFASAHFADSVNLNARKMAKGDLVKAREMMVDSMRLQPQTPEGEILRAQGILDAQVATWTNNTWASKVSSNIRKILNDVSGDVRAGDYLLPFIKTPANVIATGMDYAGMGVPKALIKTVKAIKSGDIRNPEYIKSVSRDLSRSGLGIVGAIIISSLLKDDDFVGAYDPARNQIEALRNSNTNSFRIGGKWISTAWLGPLAVPVTAMMYSRKYGKTGPEKAWQYAMGVGSAVGQIPGLSDIVDTVRAGAYKKNLSLKEMTSAALDYIASEAFSRLIPGIVTDITKVIDPVARQGSKGLPSLQAKTPGLSKYLPEKTTIFGETVKQEPAWSVILFGSRVKTDKETPLITEINRISVATDKPVTFTDWGKSNSTALAQFKEKVGEEKFLEAKKKYGEMLKQQLEITMAKAEFKRLTDEEKLKVINGKDSEVQTKIFKLYGFKPKPAKKSTLPGNL